MPGLMARILSRRADGAPETAPGPDAPTADQPTVVVPANGTGAPDGEPAAAIAAPPAAGDVTPEPEPEPAAEPDAPRASFRDRSRLRRRLRYLRRVREIGFRDLGGLVFDLDRFGRERPDLVQTKLAGLAAIDAELRSLEIALDDVRALEELHEPGISACPQCGSLHGSEARYCPSCGTPVDAPLVTHVEMPAAAPAEAPEPAAEEEPAADDEQPAAQDAPAPEQPAA
jgi:hypothetical protein